MNINHIIESLGMSRKDLFEFYLQYQRQRDAGQDKYEAAFHAYNLFELPKELIFFVILGLERVEDEIDLIKGGGDDNG